MRDRDFDKNELFRPEAWWLQLFLEVLFPTPALVSASSPESELSEVLEIRKWPIAEIVRIEVALVPHGKHLWLAARGDNLGRFHLQKVLCDGNSLVLPQGSRTEMRDCILFDLGRPSHGSRLEFCFLVDGEEHNRKIELR